MREKDRENSERISIASDGYNGINVTRDEKRNGRGGQGGRGSRGDNRDDRFSLSIIFPFNGSAPFPIVVFVHNENWKGI